jgi:hypothetical protein
MTSYYWLTGIAEIRSMDVWPHYFLSLVLVEKVRWVNTASKASPEQVDHELMRLISLRLVLSLNLLRDPGGPE